MVHEMAISRDLTPFKGRVGLMLVLQTSPEAVMEVVAVAAE